MIDRIEVPIHSSVRIGGEKVIYVDPYLIEGEPHDADIVLVTHSHYDHFSPEDIAKIRKADTKFAFPKGMEKESGSEGFAEASTFMTPGDVCEIGGVAVEAVPAYNRLKPFHPKSNGWVGYIVSAGGKRIYIAGDTDLNDDNRLVRCDIALIPIGGKFTMDAKDAAKLVDIIRPEAVIPTHYGSVVNKLDAFDEFCRRMEKQNCDVKIIRKVHRTE